MRNHSTERNNRMNFGTLGDIGSINLAFFLLDTIPAHVAVLDHTGRIVAVNAAWQRFWRENQATEFDADASFGVGTNYLFVCNSSVGYGAEEAKAAAVGIQSILEGRNNSFNLEYPCDTANGRLWFRMEASCFGGDLAGCLVAHWDITPSRLQEAALRESETHYQTMVDALSEGILVYGMDGRILVSNPAASRILGLTREQMAGAGQSAPGWSAFDEDMRPLAVADLPVSKSFREGASVRGAIIGLRRPDGSLVWLSINSEPMRSEGEGTLSGVIVTLNDITSGRRAETAMATLRKEMQDLLEWQLAGQTAASIAHELNQPLNAITVFGEAALIRLSQISPPPEKLAKAVEGMMSQAERAGRMLRELMSFFHKTELPVEAFDLNALVDEAVVLTRANGFKQFDITVEHARELKPVLANRLRIEKVCLNLLRNGMEAMAQSGLNAGNSTIGIRVVAAGDHAQVSIQDAGPGVDKETALNIFEPFFSTKPNGIGMGLTICRSLVEAHGGKLWCDPLPHPPSGRGATFHFTLPFA